MHKIVRGWVFIYLIVFMGPLMAVKKDYTPEEYKLMNRCVNEIISQLAQEMYNTYGLTCGSTGGSMPYDVETIKIGLVLQQQVSIEQARELEVRATERLIEIVNAHEAIRPYLREYPWTHQRSYILISFYQKNGQDYQDEMRLILQARDKLFYLVADKSVPNQMRDIKEELYEEAKKIVDESPSCLMSFKPPKKKFLGLF